MEQFWKGRTYLACHGSGGVGLHSISESSDSFPGVDGGVNGPRNFSGLGAVIRCLVSGGEDQVIGILGLGLVLTNFGDLGGETRR